MMSNDESSIAFARNNRTSPLGKMTAEISKMNIPEPTKDVLEDRARAQGMGVTEYARLVLMVHAHGVDYLLSLEKERLQVAALIGG